LQRKRNYFIFQHRLASGEIRNVEVHSAPIHVRGRELLYSIVHDITTRTQVAEALRESEERYKSLYNNTPVMMHSIDSQGRLLSVSDYWLRNLGYTRDEVLGRSSTDFLTEDSRRHAREKVLPQFLKTGQCNDVPYQFVKKNGEVIDVLLSAISEKDAEKHVIRSLAVIIDVTESKQAEEKLRESEESLRLAISAGRMGIWDRNFITGQLNWSVECKAIFGLPPETEMNDERFMNALHPDDRLATDLAIREAQTKQTDFNVEYRVIWPDGSLHWIAALGRWYYDKAGQAIRMAGVTLDITERKRTEEALRLEQEFVNNALDNQQDTFFLFDFTSGKALRWNRAFREISGYSDEEIAALPAPVSYYSAEDLARENDVIQRIMQGEPASIIMHLICKDGRQVATEYQAAPLKDKKGDYRFIIAVGRDITERAQAESNLRAAHETLQMQFNEINMLKETLHEQAIRDPLTNLHNRRYLDETLRHEAARARRENYPIGIILIDIDHFKEFNDTYGHSAGDEVLKSLSRLLVDSIRQGDIACRYGGEEFLVIMVGAHETDVERRADGVCRDFNKLPIHFDQQDLFATVSVGVAFYPRHGAEIQQVISSADAAMYQAKQAGRNRVQVWRAK
jgi:diguanylate cyclase (GGDEF)-like protein/PAS domain S-box-containing protein